MKKSMTSRAKTGDQTIEIVDIRQGVTATKIYDGNINNQQEEYYDYSVSGSTNLYFVSIGEADSDYIVDIDVYFNEGKIGDTINLTIAKSSEGVATFTELTNLTEEQVNFMTSLKIKFLTVPSNGKHEVYLAKKAPLS